MDTLGKPAAIAAAAALTLSIAGAWISTAAAQDCERHMLSGAGFSFDGLAGGTSSGPYPRVGITWDPDGPGPLAEVAVIGGEFEIPGLNICTWDGAQLRALGEGLDGIVRALFVYNGQLLAGGEFTTSGAGLTTTRLAAWNGSSWEPFAGGADGTVYTLHMHNGELYAGGAFNTIGGEAVPRLARFDGAQWRPVGDAPPMPISSSTTVRDLEPHEGDLYAAGHFASVGGVTAANIARWNGKAWSPLGSGVSGLSNLVYSLHSSSLAGAPQLLVGGNFSLAGGQTHHNFARWDGAAWIETDTHFGGAAGPFRFAAFGDRVIAAGQFMAVYLRDVPGSYTRMNGFSVWDGQHWSVLDPAISEGSAGQALVAYGDDLLLGGNNFAVSGQSGLVTGLGRWSGPGDTVRPVGDDVIEIVSATEYQGHVVAAGTFYFDDLRVITGLAEWDGARWRPFGSTPAPLFLYIDPTVFADSESLIVSRFSENFEGVRAGKAGRWRNGAWEEMGAISPSATLAVDGEYYASSATLGRWDGSTWVGAWPAPNNSIRSIVKFNGDIIVGGLFTSSGDLPGGIASRDFENFVWEPLNLPGGELGIPEGRVNTVAVFNNNQLIVGGSFSSAFGIACHALIIWDGTQWLPFTLTGSINASAVAPEGVYLHGTFEIPGHPGFANLALWTGSSLEPVTADNPTSYTGGRLVAHRGEVLIVQQFTSAADGRDAYGWARITREGGVPSIAQQPQSGAFNAGDTIELSVSIPSGYEPVTYQWRKGKVDLVDGPGGAGGSGVVSGATTAALTITNVNIADAGAFTVLISTECGEVLSDAAAVGVFCAADFNRDTVVNSTDVSDFINAWFEDQNAGTFITDVNHDGVVNSTDVSDFINLWFEDTATPCG